MDVELGQEEQPVQDTGFLLYFSSGWFNVGREFSGGVP